VAEVLDYLVKAQAERQGDVTAALAVQKETAVTSAAHLVAVHMEEARAVEAELLEAAQSVLFGPEQPVNSHLQMLEHLK
jgi:hypothetical protein